MPERVPVRDRRRHVTILLAERLVSSPSLSFGRPEAPTFKQVYAIARELCERAEEAWPETRAQASELIAPLREEGDDPGTGKTVLA